MGRVEQSGPPSQTPVPWPRRPLRRRLPLAVAGVVVIALVPLGIGYALGYPKEGLAAMYGAVVTLSSAMSSGLRTTRFAVPYYVLALTLGALTKPVHGEASTALFGGWAWVTLIVVLAVISGLATQRGAGVAMSMATLYAVVVPPFEDRGHVLHALIFLVVGCLYGALIAARLGASEVSPDPPTGPRQARVIALFLGLVAGIGAAIAVTSGVPHGAWLVTAIVVLGIPVPGLTERLILWRMVGQLGACAAVFVIATVISRVDPAQPTVWFGLAAFVTAVGYVTAMGSNPAVSIGFLSATLLLPAAAYDFRDIGGIVGGRLLDNFIGLAILAVALVGIRLWASPQPTSGGGTVAPH